MKTANTIKKVFLISSILFAQNTFAISKEMNLLVQLETKANAAATRSSDPVALENYEIPLKLIESSIADRANPEFINSMIFERDGQKFVRWLINPEDTKWHLEVEKFLLQNNISTARKKHFTGYMTASRSYIAVDPISKAEFSIKMSTDKTGGNWKDKQQTWDDANQIRMMTDFVMDQLKSQPKLANIVLLDEPMAFGIKGIDQAMVLRSYEALTNSKKTYVPGFSIMHEKFGRQIALANGSNDPASYWNENYNKPLARALAEFTAITGMTYDSPHSQNFLVELDANNKPTGKIVLRDFGDTYLISDFFEAIKRTDILKVWDQHNLRRGYIPMQVGILHGNKAPNWIDMVGNGVNSYNKWGVEFFKEYEKEFLRQTGVNLKLSDPVTQVSRKDAYIQSPYKLTSEEGKKFFSLTNLLKQRDHLMEKTCSYLFLLN